jgi:hypothetical protein
MKRLAFILILLLSVRAFGAITERYVATAAAGDGTGSSPGNAMSYATFKDYMEAGGSLTATAGDRFNISGSYSLGATDTWVNGGSATSPVVVRGYASSITDGFQGFTAAGALVTTNMATLAYSSTFGLIVSGNFITVENLNVTGTFSGKLFSVTGSSCAIVRCVAVNSSTNAAAVALSLGTSTEQAISCDSTNSGASGGSVSLFIASTASAEACRIKGGPAHGVILSGGGMLTNSTVFGSGSVGVNVTTTSANPLIANNTIVGNTSDGIAIITANTVMQRIYNNLITDNGGYGINGESATNSICGAYNRLDRNSLGSINLATDSFASVNYSPNVTVSTATAEFVASGSNNYRLLSASPAVGAGIHYGSSIGAWQRYVSLPGAGSVSNGTTYGQDNTNVGSFNELTGTLSAGAAGFAR